MDPHTISHKCLQKLSLSPYTPDRQTSAEQLHQSISQLSSTGESRCRDFGNEPKESQHHHWLSTFAHPAEAAKDVWAAKGVGGEQRAFCSKLVAWLPQFSMEYKKALETSLSIYHHLSVYFCRMIRYTFEKDQLTSNVNILRVLPQVDKSNGSKSSDLQIFSVSHFSIDQSRSRMRDSLSRLRARQFCAFKLLLGLLYFRCFPSQKLRIRFIDESWILSLLPSFEFLDFC